MQGEKGTKPIRWWTSLEVLASLFLILWSIELHCLQCYLKCMRGWWQRRVGWLYPLKGIKSSREYRPLVLGKTDAGCERTWQWINTCQTVSCWVVHILRGVEKFSYPLTLPCRRGVKEKRYEIWWVIVSDEGAMLLSRGKLWRANPASASGMKQSHRTVWGVNH
jgi:hypothetical protein